jgi:hypothetical protein
MVRGVHTKFIWGDSKLADYVAIVNFDWATTSSLPEQIFQI